MAVTPNIGLVKQAGTEYGDYEITNENWDKIDEEIGKRGKTINGESADANGDYKVDEVEFARQILTNDAQQGSGTFLARATGGKASLSDGDAKLISVFGRMTHTGVVHENITLTVNAVPREEGEDTITAEIDRDTFVAYVSDSGTTTLVYTDAWSANPSLYGVTVTGTPVSGDQIVIVYVKAVRGTITPSNPTRFISTGWNLYNHTNGYAKVVNYSDIFGFLIGGTYTKLEFSETLTGTKVTITPVDGYFEIPSDGYLFVTGGNNTDTYILMTWSDWDEGYEGSWQAYTESVIDFSTIMTNAFPYGLFQIGSVADEINFDKQKTYSRIQRIAYTDAAAEQAAASGRPWDADENYIYIVRETEQEYGFSTSIDGTYTASDHGMEIIDGGPVPVYVQTIYGRNLVDYIRHDVPSALTEHSEAIQKIEDQLNKGNAGSHNAIYRGESLGSSVTAAQWAAIKAGTFDDMYIGDYWTINSVTWRIAAFDYWANANSLSTHHVVIVPDSNLASSPMNSTNTTAGAYYNSDFRTGNNSNTGRSTAITAVNNAFGSGHILTYKDYLHSAVTDGHPSGQEWANCTVELMNEEMVYGGHIFAPIANGTAVYSNYTTSKSQLPLFQHEHSRISNNAYWWLRSVVSGSYFAFVISDGNAGTSDASTSRGVRPAFGIYQS